MPVNTEPSWEESPPEEANSEAAHRLDVEKRLTRLETRLDTVLPGLASKADISDVRTDIQKGIGETHRWMIGTVIGLFLGFGGLFLAMSNALKPVPAPAPTVMQQPPIIINVPGAAPPPVAPASQGR